MGEIVKLVVFVPESHADTVREAMGKAGAGVLGNYSFCTFSTKGIGRFKAEKGADPAIGEAGKLEKSSSPFLEFKCRPKNLALALGEPSSLFIQR